MPGQPPTADNPYPKAYETRVGPGGGAQMYVPGSGWTDANLFSPGTGLAGPLSPKQEANAGYAPGSMQSSYRPYLGETPDPGSNLFNPAATPYPVAPNIGKPTKAKTPAKVPLPTSLTQGELAQSARWGMQGQTNPSAQAQSAASARYTGLAAQAGALPGKDTRYNSKTGKGFTQEVTRPNMVGGTPGQTPRTYNIPPGTGEVKNNGQSGALLDQRKGEQNPVVPGQAQPNPIQPGQGMSGSPMDVGGPYGGAGSTVQETTSKPPMIPNDNGRPVVAPGWVQISPGVWQNLNAATGGNGSAAALPNRYQAMADSGQYKVGNQTMPLGGDQKKPPLDANGNAPMAYDPARAALANAARLTGSSMFSTFSNVNTRPNVMTPALVEQLPYREAGFNTAEEFMKAEGYVLQTDLDGKPIWVRLDIGGPKSGGVGKPQAAYNYGYSGGWGYGNYGRAAYGSGGLHDGGGGYGNGPGLMRWNIHA